MAWLNSKPDNRCKSTSGYFILFYNNFKPVVVVYLAVLYKLFSANHYLLG